MLVVCGDRATWGDAAEKVDGRNRARRGRGYREAYVLYNGPRHPVIPCRGPVSAEHIGRAQRRSNAMNSCPGRAPEVR